MPEFPDLKSWHISGDDFPYKNHDFQVSGEQASVLIKFIYPDHGFPMGFPMDFPIFQ